MIFGLRVLEWNHNKFGFRFETLCVSFVKSKSKQRSIGADSDSCNLLQLSINKRGAAHLPQLPISETNKVKIEAFYIFCNWFYYHWKWLMNDPVVLKIELLLWKTIENFSYCAPRAVLSLSNTQIRAIYITYSFTYTDVAEFFDRVVNFFCHLSFLVKQKLCNLKL